MDFGRGLILPLFNLNQPANSLAGIYAEALIYVRSRASDFWARRYTCVTPVVSTFRWQRVYTNTKTAPRGSSARNSSPESPMLASSSSSALYSLLAGRLLFTRERSRTAAFLCGQITGEIPCVRTYRAASEAVCESLTHQTNAGLQGIYQT